MIHLECNVLNHIDRFEDDSHGESRSSANGSSRNLRGRMLEMAVDVLLRQTFQMRYKVYTFDLGV